MSIFHAKPQMHFILMIGDDGVVLAAHGEGAPAPFYVCHQDQTGMTKIMALIDQYPEANVILFADMLAQDYRRESLPKLNPLDRHKLIKRRLQKAFPQAQLTANIFLTADRANILLVGLHNNGPLTAWLGRLQHRAPRICLLPIECADLVGTLLPDADKNWALMISRHQTGGFRQIVTHKGAFIFTRLTPPLPEDVSYDMIAETIQRDITATLGYLGRFGLNDTQELHVMLLMPEATHDVLQDMALPVHSLTLLSPHKAARHYGFSFAPDADDAYGDLFFAGHLAQKKKPRLCLMLPHMRKIRQNEAIRYWGLRGAVALLALGIASTLWHASGLFSVMMDTHHASTELAVLQKTLTQNRATAAAETEPLGKLREAIERQRLFAQSQPTPWKALQQISQGLSDQARLIKLNWQDDDGKTISETMTIEAQTIDKTAGTDDRQAIVASGRHIVQTIAQTMPDYAVEVTHYPFPALPQDTLSNENGAKNADDKNNLSTSLSIRRITP